MKKVTIFILTHSPRGYIEKIISALSSSAFILKNTNIIVSTNATDAEYVDYLTRICADAGVCMKVHDTCDAHTHAHNNYFSCTTDLCMLLHDDDDIFIRDFEAYISNVLCHPGFGSYSCNDKVIINDRIKSNGVSGSESRTLCSFEVSVAYLLNRHAVCYPSIVYNKRLLKVDFLDQRFGKHTDALLVSKLIDQKHLFFGIPAIGYRIHDQQDSAQKCHKKTLLKIYLLKRVFRNISLGNLFILRRILNRIRYRYIE